MDKFIVGKTPIDTPIYASLDSGFLAAIFAQSGAGKTVLCQRLLQGMMLTYGADFQCIIIDPKRVGFFEYINRAHIYTDENDWPRLLQSLENEMLRRYEEMAQAGCSSYAISPERPFLLLVIDELNSVTNNQTLTKKERDEVIAKLISLSNQMRQASMGYLLISQTADTSVLPSIVRANTSTRFIMKMASTQQIKMATGDREDEVSPLYMPGEFYALTSETNGRYVRGKAKIITPDKVQEVMRKVNPDKRPLRCLDWSNPDFLG